MVHSTNSSRQRAWRYSLKTLQVIALVVSSTVLVACAGVTQPSTPEELVTQRAQARLDLMVAGDFAQALEYATPAYRKGRGLNSYTRAYAGVSAWNKAQVSSVLCSGERCEVAVEVTYQAFRAGFENKRSMEELWIRVDGSWYLYLK